MLNLFDFSHSSAAYRVRIALHLKGLAYDRTSIHLLKAGGQQHMPSYTQINPQKLVPALQTDEGIITQSLAIIEYLDEVHPTPPLLPQDSKSRALVRAMTLAIAADTHPIQNLRVLQYLRSVLKLPEPDVTAWARHWVELGLKAFQDLSSQATVEGAYAFGDQVTLADIVLVPQMVNARRFGCDLSAVPRLLSIEAALLKLPAFSETAAAA